MTRFGWLLVIMLAGGHLCGCGDARRPSPAGRNDQGGLLTPLTLQLNWKPEPQFGGFYEAVRTGAFAARGLQVTINAGGAGSPTIQMIGAGTVEFGIVSGDEIVLAHARGNRVIGLFPVYQTNPQGIMTRAARGLTSIGDLLAKPGTLAIERGLPYAVYLEKNYGWGQLKIVPSPFGDLTQLRSASDYAMQCFVTSEPLAARKQGLEVTTFLIAEAGWNPYTTVLACSDAYLRYHPQIAPEMVAAVTEGWIGYLNDPTPTNQMMAKLNPTMTPQTFAASAAAQVELIRTKEIGPNGIGLMTRARWQKLAADMHLLGLIEKIPLVEQLYHQPEAH